MRELTKKELADWEEVKKEMETTPTLIPAVINEYNLIYTLVDEGCLFTTVFKAMATPSKIDLATAVLDRFDHSNDKSYTTLSGLRSTLWHRDHGRPSVQQKGAKQQYLTIQEEKALVNYVLQMSKNGYAKT